MQAFSESSALNKKAILVIDNLTEYVEVLKSDVATANAIAETNLALLEAFENNGEDLEVLIGCLQLMANLNAFSSEASNDEINRLREDNRWCRMAVDSQLEECQQLRKELEEANNVV